MKKIKELRISRGLTQNDIAIELGLSQSTVAMWENGKNVPSSSVLPKLSKILGCTIDELFDDTDESA